MKRNLMHREQNRGGVITIKSIADIANDFVFLKNKNGAKITKVAKATTAYIIRAKNIKKVGGMRISYF